MKNNYNKFGDNILYKYAHIPPEMFVKELIDIMINDIINIKERMKTNAKTNVPLFPLTMKNK